MVERMDWVSLYDDSNLQGFIREVNDLTDLRQRIDELNKERFRHNLPKITYYKTHKAIFKNIEGKTMYEAKKHISSLGVSK